MSKVFQAFLSGIFFTYFIDFFFFLGLKTNYIDFLEIDLYYNILFADNQNVFVFSALTLLLGFVTIYLKSTLLKTLIVTSIFLLAASTNIPSIGYKAGDALFMEENITLKNYRHSFTGDIQYNGRKDIVFYDYDLEKIILLNKKELIK